MMNLWKITTEWQQMLSLLDNYDKLTADELVELNAITEAAKQDVAAFLAQGMDALEMITAQHDFASSKIDELQAIKKKLARQQEKVKALLKQAVVITNQKQVPVGAYTLSISKNPASLVIDDDSLIADVYKQITITLPLPLAKEIAWNYNLDVDWKKAETLKSEIKKLMTRKENPVEFPGCRLVQDTKLSWGVK